MSIEEKTSQADLLRVWIDAKLDSDTKFYAMQSKSKQDRIDFVNAHPQLNTTESRVKPSFHKILDERLKLRKINPKDAKVTRKKLPKFQASDMNPTVEPQPQNTTNQQQQQNDSTVDNRNNKFAPSGTTAIPGQQPIPGQAPGMPYVNPNVTVESIGALAQGATYGIKAILPDLEILTDEEKKSIGEILLLPLSRITDERIQLYLFPIIGVLGIFGPKIAKARTIKKEKNLKKNNEKKVAKKESKSKKTLETNLIEDEDTDDEEKGNAGW